MRQGWLGNSQHTGPMVRTTPTLCNDVAFPSYRKYSQALTVGTWVEIVRCGFFPGISVFCMSPPRLEWTFVLSTTTTIQLPSTWLTHMECAKVPKIKLNCLDVSVSDISECLWGACRRILVCPVWFMHTESIVSVAPWRKGISVKYTKLVKNEWYIQRFRQHALCTMCVCVLSNKLALRRLLVTHSFFIFPFEECENWLDGRIGRPFV